MVSLKEYLDEPELWVEHSAYFGQFITIVKLTIFAKIKELTELTDEQINGRIQNQSFDLAEKMTQKIEQLVLCKNRRDNECKSKANSSIAPRENYEQLASILRSSYSQIYNQCETRLKEFPEDVSALFLTNIENGNLSKLIDLGADINTLIHLNYEALESIFEWFSLKEPESMNKDSLAFFFSLGVSFVQQASVTRNLSYTVENAIKIFLLTQGNSLFTFRDNC